MSIRNSFIKSVHYAAGHTRSSTIRQRCLHNSHIINAPASQASAAKFLVGLKKLEQGGESKSLDMENEAREWLESIRRLRKDFETKYTVFNPNKALALHEGDEIDILREARDSAREKFIPSELQLAEAVEAKSTPIPPKTDSTLQFLTNLLMRHGRKAQAQKIMSRALYIVHLRTRLEPVGVLKSCLNAMAPCVKLRRYTDGGARTELVPVPLNERQRLRQAWVWLMEASTKRPSKDFAVRLAEEIISAQNGKSPGFLKKEAQQKLAIANRAYTLLMQKR